MGTNTNLEYLVLRATGRGIEPGEDLGASVKQAIDVLAATYEGVSIPRYVVDTEVLTTLWRLADLSEQHLGQLKELNHTAAHPIATRAREFRTRGLWAWAQDLLDEATEDFLRAVQADPFDYQSHLHIGHWYLLCQEFADAEQAYRSAARYAHVASNGAGYSPGASSGELDRSAPTHPSFWEALALMGEARAQHGLGQLAEAVRLADEARALAPRRFDIVFELARAAATAGLTNVAKEALFEAFEIDAPLTALLVTSESSIIWPEETVERVLGLSWEANSATRELVLEMHSDPGPWGLADDVDDPPVPRDLRSTPPESVADLPLIWQSTKAWYRYASEVAGQVGSLPSAEFDWQLERINRSVGSWRSPSSLSSLGVAMARLILPISPIAFVAGLGMLVAIVSGLIDGEETVSAMVTGGGLIGSAVWLATRSALRSAAAAHRAAPERMINEWERSSGAARYLNEIRSRTVERLSEVAALPCSGLTDIAIEPQRQDVAALVISQLGTSPEGIRLTAILHQIGVSLR